MAEPFIVTYGFKLRIAVIGLMDNLTSFPWPSCCKVYEGFSSISIVLCGTVGLEEILFNYASISQRTACLFMTITKGNHLTSCAWSS